MLVIVVESEHQGMRLDLFLAQHLGTVCPQAGWSRAAIQKMIAGGGITLNRRTAKPSARLRSRDRIEVRPPPARKTALTAEPLPLEILYEDEDCMVINKAPGTVVHPGAGRSSGTLVNALLHHCPNLEGVGGERRPGIVHRLDKDTSGVMVIAKSAPAYQHLTRQFKERTVVKEYLALVWGKMVGSRGVIDRPIGRHRTDRKKMSSLRHVARAREAITEWQVANAFRVGPEGSSWSWMTLLRLRPRTGRTHQIRVHLAERGNPVLGDRVYGWKRQAVSQSRLEVAELADFPRQALHAERLGFDHPRTGERLEFRAPLPEDMRKLLQLLAEWRGRGAMKNERGVDKQVGFS